MSISPTPATSATRTASRVSCICATLFTYTLRRRWRAPFRSCRRWKRRSSPRSRVVPVAVLSSVGAARWPAHSVRCPLSDALDCLRAVQGAGATPWQGSSTSTADAKLTELLVTLANCPRSQSLSIYPHRCLRPLRASQALRRREAHAAIQLGRQADRSASDARGGLPQAARGQCL
jgi:hypothetical protein